MLRPPPDPAKSSYLPVVEGDFRKVLAISDPPRIREQAVTSRICYPGPPGGLQQTTRTPFFNRNMTARSRQERRTALASPQGTSRGNRSRSPYGAVEVRDARLYLRGPESPSRREPTRGGPATGTPPPRGVRLHEPLFRQGGSQGRGLVCPRQRGSADRGLDADARESHRSRAGVVGRRTPAAHRESLRGRGRSLPGCEPTPERTRLPVRVRLAVDDAVPAARKPEYCCEATVC